MLWAGKIAGAWEKTMNRWIKLLVVAIAAVMVAGTATVGQAQDVKPDVKPKPTAPLKAKKPAKALYACVKCDCASMKAGKCPQCGAQMTKIKGKVVYTCAQCHTKSMKAGKCPKCGKMMGKTATTYCCDECHMTSAKKGNCPKCGKPMKQHKMPVK